MGLEGRQGLIRGSKDWEGQLCYRPQREAPVFPESSYLRLKKEEQQSSHSGWRSGRTLSPSHVAVLFGLRRGRTRQRAFPAQGLQLRRRSQRHVQRAENRARAAPRLQGLC